MTSGIPIRCPECHKLLGRRREDGVEVREGGRLLAVIRKGEIVCGRGRATVLVTRDPADDEGPPPG